MITQQFYRRTLSYYISKTVIENVLPRSPRNTTVDNPTCAKGHKILGVGRESNKTESRSRGHAIATRVYTLAYL